MDGHRLRDERARRPRRPGDRRPRLRDQRREAGPQRLGPSPPSTFRVRWRAAPTRRWRRTTARRASRPTCASRSRSSTVRAASGDDAPALASMDDLIALAATSSLTATTAAALVARLAIGAPPPEHYGSGTYSALDGRMRGARRQRDTVHARRADGASTPRRDGHLRVVVNGTRVHLANRESRAWRRARTRFGTRRRS